MSEGDGADTNQEFSVYPFFFSDGKGKKALVRFRESLRKHYSHCGKNTGLTVLDDPYLQLFCYDPDTKLGYCRLYSKNYQGPIFPDPKSLYEVYNCSSQGHLNDIFYYNAPGDPDNGKELTSFLDKIQIVKPSSLPQAVIDVFEAGVKDNKMLAAYPEALEEKRKKKATEQRNNAEKRKRDSLGLQKTNLKTNEAPQTEGDVETGIIADNETTAVSGNVETGNNDDNEKKRPGRPKGSKSAQERRTKRNKTDSEGIDVHTFVPASLKSIDINDKDLNNVTGSFTYLRENMRLGDFPESSIERAALCWNVFSFLLKGNSNQNGIKINPNVSAEEFLRSQLLGIEELEEPQE